MKTGPHQTRKGSLMVCVLACLAIVASLVGWIARDAVQARRETRLRLQLMQTERLLDAGILRASIRSRQDPEYEGESWQPGPQTLGQNANPVVTITVKDGQTSVTAKIGSQPNITTQSYVLHSSEVQ